VGLVAVILLLAACQPQATASSPSASALPSPSSAAVGFPSTCDDIQMRAPNGDEVWLAGIWHGNEDAYWVFTQIGNCVWATATDAYPRPGDPTAAWQIYLRGTVQDDFTIPVEFAYSSLSTTFLGPHWGHAVLSIELAADGSASGMKLRKIGGCNASGGCPTGEGSLQTTEWTQISSELILPPPTPGT
jgi:hypothetical protein